MSTCLQSQAVKIGKACHQFTKVKYTSQPSSDPPPPKVATVVKAFPPKTYAVFTKWSILDMTGGKTTQKLRILGLAPPPPTKLRRILNFCQLMACLTAQLFG